MKIQLRLSLVFTIAGFILFIIFFVGLNNRTENVFAPPLGGLPIFGLLCLFGAILFNVVESIDRKE